MASLIGVDAKSFLRWQVLPSSCVLTVVPMSLPFSGLHHDDEVFLLDLWGLANSPSHGSAYSVVCIP